MKKETLAILDKVKRGEMSIDLAQRQLFVLFEQAKSVTCKLDRLPKDCSIIQNTSFKNCDGCGHYIKN